MVALQREMAAPGTAEVRPLGKLAGFHLRFPVRAPELVLEQLRAIQPVFDVRPVRNDARAVPLTDRVQVSGGSITLTIPSTRDGVVGAAGLGSTLEGTLRAVIRHL